MNDGIKNRFLLVLIFTLFLTSCVDTAVTGAQALYNRHSIQKNLNDQYITMRVHHEINQEDNRFKDCNIAIATFNQVVLIAGQTPDPWQRQEIEKIVKSIPDVKKVYNFITISNPSSPLIQLSDSWITAKIRAKYISSADVDPSQVKVVTENGTVYLLGVLQPEQANAAVAFAQTTEGVQNIVKIFEYLKLSKTA